LKKFAVFILSVLAVVSSCNNSPVTPPSDDGVVIYNRAGLVDSAVVNGCYPNTRRFFVDTLSLAGYSKLKVEFNGLTNSDGSYIKVFYNSADSSNVELYHAEDETAINNNHSFEFNKPANTVWMEVRIYINPPVCGEGEFKFTRARDLKIYGIK
jgi:hypothetical protein